MSEVYMCEKCFAFAGGDFEVYTGGAIHSHRKCVVCDAPAEHWLCSPRSVIKTLIKRITAALETAVQFGQFDGGHHKAWVIDQLVRTLAAGNYDALVKEAKAGEDGPDSYDWDVGIPP